MEKLKEKYVIAKQGVTKETKTLKSEVELKDNQKMLSLYSMQLEDKNRMWREALARVQQLEKDMVVIFQNSQKSKGESISEEIKQRLVEFEALIAAKDATLIKVREQNHKLAHAVFLLEQ